MRQSPDFRINRPGLPMTFKVQLEPSGRHFTVQRIYQELFETCSYERFRLKVAMLNTLELHLEGRFATMQILKKDLEETGGTYAETENLINESRVIKTVDTTALFIELGDGRIRCSLRSKGALDVGKIAEKFGGGGHKMAAGTFVPAPIENAKKIIYNEVSSKFE